MTDIGERMGTGRADDEWAVGMRAIGYDPQAPVGGEDFALVPLFGLRNLRRGWLFLATVLVLVAGCTVLLVHGLRSVVAGRIDLRRIA